MRLKLPNFAYPVLGIAATGWVLNLHFGQFLSQNPASTTTSSALVAAIPDLLLLSGFLFLLFTLYKFGGRKQAIDSVLKGRIPGDITKPPESPGVALFKAELEKLTSISEEEIEFSDLEFGLTSISNLTYVPSDQYNMEFHSMDPVKESRLLASYGKIDDALEIIRESFASTFENHDELAIAFMDIVEAETENDEINAKRLKELFAVRDRFLNMLARERGKLSDEAWLKIRMDYSVQAGGNSFNPALHFDHKRSKRGLQLRKRA